jgi:hypothetical protein
MLNGAELSQAQSGVMRRARAANRKCPMHIGHCGSRVPYLAISLVEYAAGYRVGKENVTG